MVRAFPARDGTDVQNQKASKGAGRRTPTGRLVRRIWSDYMSRYKRDLVIGLISIAVVAGTTGAIAHMMEPIINEIFINQNREKLFGIPLMIIGIFTVMAVATFGQHYVMRAVGIRVANDVQGDLYDRMIRSDLRFFYNHTVGQSISRFLTDAQMMQEALATTFVALVRDSMTAIALIIVMFTKDWQMALVAMIVLPAAGLPIARIGRLSRKSSQQVQQASGFLASFLSDTLTSIRQVKAYNREDYEARRARDALAIRLATLLKNLRVRALISPIIEVIAGVAVAAAVLYGGIRVIEGALTPGAFFAFLTALLLAASPIRQLGKVNAAFQSGLAAAERLFDALDSLPQIEDRSGGRELKVPRGHVRFDDVRFVYPDGTEALHGITLECRPGETIALVGQSGGGKSTILNLVGRFYDTSGGQVTIDNQAVDAVSVESLRRAIGFVSQETALFDDTVRANIAYSKPDATDDEIEAAAEGANAHGFISALPDGYQTVVGSAGFRLSGGQRQRIAIARAMLRDAPILLLDEATSALDADSERKVQAALNRLQKGRSTITVAHRLSTVINADRIYVIEDGRVAESGSHGELMARGGRYAELYSGDAEITAAAAVGAE
ncbi:ABC transporter permease [Minwuia thermotolerans]|uniref:ABC transporter permease n=1 Tax=Minwuia thermotolerans TaxID=2056226 RepID=A0A2M9FY95_9PROT|nr:ABC transporter permease [Minwuia thermotolerans]